LLHVKAGIHTVATRALYAPVQTGPGAYPASFTMGTGLSRGLSCRGVALTTAPSSAEVKERVDLYICSTPGPSWLVG